MHTLVMIHERPFGGAQLGTIHPPSPRVDFGMCFSLFPHSLPPPADCTLGKAYLREELPSSRATGRSIWYRLKWRSCQLVPFPVYVGPLPLPPPPSKGYCLVAGQRDKAAPAMLRRVSPSPIAPSAFRTSQHGRHQVPGPSQLTTRSSHPGCTERK